jgi:hypothetical protein
MNESRTITYCIQGVEAIFLLVRRTVASDTLKSSRPERLVAAETDFDRLVIAVERALVNKEGHFYKEG